MTKITLYELDDELCKSDLSDDDEISKVLTIKAKEIELSLPKSQARLFIREEPQKRPPEWVSYLSEIIINPLDLHQTFSVGALLLVKPEKNLYGIAWGNGRYLLKSEAIKKDMGILCALKILDGAIDQKWNADQIRSITTKRIDDNTLNAQFQYTKLTDLEAFPFIKDTDFLRSITFTPGVKQTKEDWGTISGGVSLNFRTKESSTQIINICKKLDAIVEKNEWPEHYSFIENVRPENDAKKIKMLDEEFSKRILGNKKNETEKLYLSPPEIVDWASISQFAYYVNDNTSQIIDEPEIDSMLNFINQQEIQDILEKDFFSDQIQLIGYGDERDYRWPLLNWIGLELSLENNNHTDDYIRDGGNYYKINHEYLKLINGFIAESEITKEKTEYEPFLLTKMDVKAELRFDGRTNLNSKNKKNESDKENNNEKDEKNSLQGDNKPKPYPEENYVSALFTKNINNALVMHCCLSKSEEKEKEIEVCDVALNISDGNDKKKNRHYLIHLKAGTHSGSLSHLFSQACVSAELLDMMSETFKNNTKDAVNTSFQEIKRIQNNGEFDWLYSSQFDTRQATVVMGIIAKGSKNLAETMPFFSKVNYRMRCRELQKMGYDYKIVKLDQYYIS